MVGKVGTDTSGLSECNEYTYTLSLDQSQYNGPQARQVQPLPPLHKGVLGVLDKGRVLTRYIPVPYLLCCRCELDTVCQHYLQQLLERRALTYTRAMELLPASSRCLKMALLLQSIQTIDALITLTYLPLSPPCPPPSQDSRPRVVQGRRNQTNARSSQVQYSTAQGIYIPTLPNLTYICRVLAVEYLYQTKYEYIYLVIQG